jgi:hypothetical protein
MKRLIGGKKMVEEINHDRRRFLGTAAMVFALRR